MPALFPTQAKSNHPSIHCQSISGAGAGNGQLAIAASTAALIGCRCPFRASVAAKRGPTGHGIGRLVDQQAQHGPVASVTTSWRMLDRRIDAQHLVGVKKARPAAREKVWAAGGAPQRGTTLVIDMDATITVDQSEGQGPGIVVS